METWVREQLAPVIEGDELVLQEDENGRQAVPIATFVALFAPDVTIPSYSNLLAADGQKGYEPYIREWRAKGWI